MKELNNKNTSILILLFFMIVGIVGHEITHNFTVDFTCVACEVSDDDITIANISYVTSIKNINIAIYEIKYFYKSKYSSHQSRAPPLI
ncbi:MAG: hypothetical protein CMQ51_01070 [Gammaproteobacteria bacterium]|nr:hypothetical protein [Gammaproteobacteria bacterium]|tara:strand:+ start:2854 stop:3117 length:264 start_codon:yes stop_codon:yes gene_type:complete